MLQPVVFAGLFIGILSALPIISVGNCCCLWIVGGGFLAAYLDQDRRRTFNPVRGFTIGLLAGVVGAVVWVIGAVALDVVLAPLQQRLLAEIVRGTQEIPPAARDWLEMAGDSSRSVLRFTVGFFLHLFGAVFAGLGGLLGAAYFRPDVPPALGGPVVPPSIPPH